LAITAAVSGYTAFVTGKLNGSAIFLGLCAVALIETLRLLYAAARSLFVEPPPTEVAVATGRRKKELEREKASLLKALKELEFDHEMRKVSDADFAEIGGAYRARAIRVLRQLDDRDVDYARLVEEEIARVRWTQKPATGDRRPATGNSEALVAEAGGCAGCGTVNDADAVFCKKCARRLKEDVA
jgi:hypothetical protein